MLAQLTGQDIPQGEGPAQVPFGEPVLDRPLGRWRT